MPIAAEYLIMDFPILSSLQVLPQLTCTIIAVACLVTGSTTGPEMPGGVGTFPGFHPASDDIHLKIIRSR